MSNDLAEFFATLLRIARWILDVTLTLICSVLLLVASLLPWRLPFICKELAEESTSLTWKKFQSLAALQFLMSLIDVLVFVWLLPSFVWPLRWPALAVALKKAQEPGDDDEEDDHQKQYRLVTRVDFLIKGFESYLDFLLLPLVLLLSLVPWRWCLHVKKLRSAFEVARGSEDPCERISAFRNWAASESFSGLLDLPFAVLGLSSLVVPTRGQAFISLLLRRGLEPEAADCEARIYLAVLPFLSVCDFLVAFFALVALANPLRCGMFLRLMFSKWNGKLEKTGCVSAELQEVVHWNAQLRAVALRSGLASLLDLLLLPLGLVVCITVYRAKPLVSEMCSSRSADSRGLATLNEEEELPLSKIHKVVLRQSTLLLCDLLTLPSLLVVYGSYRYPFVQPMRDDLRKCWGPVAHHVAVFLNSLVLLHDLLLALCTLPVLLTIYRVPKVFRLLHERACFRPGPEPHPEAAEVTQEPVLEVAACGHQTRVKLWQEIGHLLLDLPLLPLLLIVICSIWRADLVLQQCWSIEDDCQRRKAVVLQFLELLRDVLAFFALLLVCVTLFRMPKVLLDIYSQRARPVAGVPRFLLRRVSVFVGDGSDQRLLVRAEAVQEVARSLEEIGVIRINVISKTFWDDIARIFGASVASLGKALLPFTLKDGKHVKYSDFLPEEANVELRLGGRELKSKLLQLEGSIAMCVQLEHRDPSGSTEILTRLPIPAHLLQQAVSHPGEVVEVPEELLTVAPEMVCGDLLSGAGIRNAMWLCALSEVWQLLLDLIHLVLFIFLMVAPWRLLQCIYFACRPSQVWHGTVARKLSSLLLVKEAVLKLYRRQLEPELNAAAKDPPRRTSRALSDLASQLLAGQPLPSASAEAALLGELEPNPDAATFVKTVKSYSFLQNAVSSYWPGLTLAANLQLANQSFSPQEHALAIEKISNAQSRADDLLLSLSAEVQAASLEFKRPKGAGPLSNACGKSLSEHRRLVQVFVFEVLKDYGTVLLGLLLLLSIYRLPAVLRGLRQERQADLVQRLRIVLNCQVRLLVWDLWMFFTALLASILAIVTLVRALEFLRKAFLHCESLADLRREALEAAKDAITSLWELLSLLTLWDTYKTLVYASIFSLLLPAWGLIPLPIWLRIVFWLGLCSLPFLLPSVLHALFTYGLVVALFFVLALVKKGPGSSASPAYLKSLRMTGMNALVLLSIVVDATLLCSIDYVEAVLQKDVCFYIATAVTIAWLVVLSLPHAISSDDTCLKSGKFHVSLQLLRRCALPSALVFLEHLEPGPASSWCCLLLAFLIFSSVLGLDLLSQDHLPESIGLDLLQPPAFIAGFTFLQTIFAVLSMRAPSEEWEEWLPCVAAFLMPLWVIVFQCWGGIGGPLWLLPLHLGTSTVVLWFALERSILHGLVSLDQGVVVLLAAMTMVSMVICECLAQKQRRQAMEKAGVSKVLHQILEKLSKKGLQLESHQRVPIRDTLSPQSVAKELEAFEASTKMEGLSTSFLELRKEWLSRLHLRRSDYDVVAECGHQLLEAVCTPPSNLQIFLLLRRKSGRRIPSAIWQMILEYVSDVRYVSRMLTPLVNHFGSGGPGKQLLRARQLMDTLGQRSSDAASASLHGESQELTQPRKGVSVTVEPNGQRGSPWRGRMVGTARNGINGAYVEAIAPLQRRKRSEFVPLERLRVEKQTFQERIDEDLGIWWREAVGVFGGGCPCGRPLPPSTRQGLLHCFRRRKYHFCCPSCESGRDPHHSDSCNARAARSKDLFGPRHLSSGCPRAMDAVDIVESNVGSTASSQRDTE